MVGTLFLIEALKEGFIGILLTLDTLIYGLIASAFKIFMAIAGARLLSSSAYSEIANKVYVLVGVIMLFVLSYAILRGIIDPDKETKGEFGSKMVGRIVLAVVGLAATPFIFDLMYQAQGLMLENDVLGKIFFRIENTDKVTPGGAVTVGDQTVNMGGSVNPDEYVKSIGGAVTAVNLWQAFFYPSEDSGKTADQIVASADGYFLSAVGNGIGCAAGLTAAGFASTIPVVGWVVGGALAIGSLVTVCLSTVNDVTAGVNAASQLDGDITLADAYALASGGGGFGIFTVFLDNYAEEGEITYLFGISTVAGAFALYAFVSFSIDMGIRAASLAYYQIIAPIPLILQVIPKFKGNFDTYIKKVTSTFIEVFVRISVVYVVVYIICHLTELFSSIALWGEHSGLNTAEQLLALALLILGLIAFCRRAPGIISETFNLPKGNMSLGIGKKLAEGGFQAGTSILGGGLKAGVNSANEAAERGLSMGRRARSFVSGFGGGAARAAMNNFGPGHKPAETFRQARDIMANSAQAAYDAQYNKLDNEEEHKKAVAARADAIRRNNDALNDLNAADTNKTAAQSAFDAVVATGARAGDAAYDTAKATLDAANKDYDAAVENYKKTSAALTEARKRAMATTALGVMATDASKSIKAWSTGTINTAKEEATVKFGNALDSLKGSLREEAYKKDHDPGGAAALKAEYDRKKSEPIRQYVEGWDEQSANAEYRRRLGDVTRDATLAPLISALNTARASGVAADITAARTALETALSASGFGYASIGSDNKIQIDMSDIKIDQKTAIEMRDKELEGLRIAMEARADTWVNEQALDQNSNTHHAIQEFLTQNASYISDNPTTQIVVDYRADGTPIYKTVAEVLTEGFGEGAVNAKFEITDALKNQFRETDIFSVEETAEAGGGKYTYKYNTSTGEYEAYDSDDHRIAGAPTFRKDQFFEEIRRGVVAGKYKKVGSKSKVSSASEIGKTASRYVSNNTLAEKMIRKRQQAENNKK